MNNKIMMRVMCACTIYAYYPNTSYANDIIWDNSVVTGIYNSDVNWLGGIAPASIDRAIFDVGSDITDFHTLTFDNNLTNNALLIDRGLFTIDLAGYTYNLTGAGGFTVNGSTDTTFNGSTILTGLANFLTIENGELNVTNDITFTGYGTIPATSTATFLNTTISSLNGLIDFNVATIGGGGVSPTDTVSLSSTTWVMSGDITTGLSGRGKLTIDSTSSISSVNGYIGRDADSVGSITNDGSLGITSSLYVGGSSTTDGGTGELINNGALTITDTLKVWSNGSATLNGTVSAAIIDIDGSASFGGDVNASTVNVSGSANIISNTVTTSLLNLNNGADVSGSGTVGVTDMNASGTVGIGAVRINAATVNVNGTTNINGGVINTTDFYATGGSVSLSGSALSVNSGVLNNDNQELSLRSGGANLQVLGGASAVGISNLYIGGDEVTSEGVATLAVSDSSVNVTNVLKIWSQGVVNVNDGTLVADSLVVDGGFNLNGGAVTASQLTGTGQFNLNAGTLQITSPDFTVSDLTPLGPALTLSDAQTLSIAGTTTIASTAQLVLDGGTLFTDTLINNGSLDFNRGTLDLLNFTVGDTGLFGSTLQVNDIQKQINIRGTTTVDNGALLHVAAGSLTSNSYINNGEIQLSGPTSLLAGGAISNNALITGDGRADVALTNSSTGEIRAYSGDRLHFSDLATSMMAR